ncbi:hypothetical protein RPMA_19100 [Tardiphaga alba]|uniref:Uncharacterized protein n=1 Tax=Tardiphaga alba TaxID=340268 RepID=A0ABX8AAC0_9BRAD|nr:hypothetical protein [Tardiphaga alba]QUS40703.1 hypothetical protein RPMA_19100 [Tardiphaga alba]
MVTAKKVNAKGKPSKPKSKLTANKAASKKSKPVKAIANQIEADPASDVEATSPMPVIEPPKPISVEPWSELTIGHIVAAFDKRGAGYFPAMIVAMSDGKLTMRWHKYDEDTAKFTRKVEQVALLHPSVKS